MDETIPQGEQAPATNRPFGHAMTRRAQEVTVPIHDHTPMPQPPRRIPVQGPADAQTDMPVDRTAGDESVA